MPLPVTASKLQLADVCAFPFGRGVVRMAPQDSSAAAREGNAFHECAYLRITQGEVSEDDIRRIAQKHGANLEAAQNRVRGWLVEWPALAPENAEAELAVTYDALSDTARVIGRDIGRDYEARGAGEDDLCGSLDVMAEEDGHLVVIDHKTGRPENTSPANSNLQLMFGAYVMAKLRSAHFVRVAIHHVDPHGHVTVDAADFDAWELEQIGLRLRRIVAEVLAESAPQPGPHCVRYYCPALGTCPAQRESLSELLSDGLSINITSPEDLQAAHDRRAAGERLLKTIREAEKSYVDAHGGAVPLPDGRTYRRVSRRGSVRLDAAAVRERFGGDYDVASPDSVFHRVVGRPHAKPLGE